MAEDNRIKIRELPAGDVSGSDTIAVAKNNIEKTVQASLTDAVRAGLTIEAGPGITVTQTATGIKISGTAEFDDGDIRSDLSDLQAQINALKNADPGTSVKAQPSPPIGSSNGDLWWDTNTASMYIRYNSAWVQTNGGGGGAAAEIADTDAPGVVAPDSSFKVGHSGHFTLNSYVTIPTLDRSDASGGNTRPRWQPNYSYFKGQHFRGPDISGNDVTFGTPIRDIIYKTSRAYTSSNNFINDMNAKKHFYPGSASGKGVEGGQLAIKNPDNVDMCIDTYKDVNNWFGRGMRSYIRFHDNTANGYQLLFDPFAGGGAWLAHSPDLKIGQSTGALIPWGGGGKSFLLDKPTILYQEVGYSAWKHEYMGDNIATPQGTIKAGTTPGIPANATEVQVLGIVNRSSSIGNGFLFKHASHTNYKRLLNEKMTDGALYPSTNTAWYPLDENGEIQWKFEGGTTRDEMTLLEIQGYRI